MTRIEQINWARQILSQTPTVPERDDETVKYLTEANLRLREALEAMTSKRDEATERAHRHLAVLACSKEYQAAQKKSLKAAEARASLEPGSSRARVTTANARWAMAAEARDRIKDRLSAEWEAEQ